MGELEKGLVLAAMPQSFVAMILGVLLFFGAGAVVTKMVPNYALVVGNPARQIGWMSEFGHRLDFNKDGMALCPESKEKYQLINGKVTKQ